MKNFVANSACSFLVYFYSFHFLPFYKAFRFFLFSCLAPVQPPDVTLELSSATSISIQWTFNNSVRNVLGVLLGFKVRYRAEGDNFGLVQTIKAQESSLTLDSLSPYTTYNIKVGAFTKAGETKSNALIARTLEDGRSFSYSVESRCMKSSIDLCDLVTRSDD